VSTTRSQSQDIFDVAAVLSEPDLGVSLLGTLACRIGMVDSKLAEGNTDVSLPYSTNERTLIVFAVD
jgi:hypothetical protein